MNGRITRNNCSAVRPVAFLPYQFIAHRIGERVEAKTREGVAPSFLFAQDVIVRLMLPLATAAQGRFKMRAQKFHGVELIALAAQAHPDEVQMIGHETVSGQKSCSRAAAWSISSRNVAWNASVSQPRARSSSVFVQQTTA